MTWFSFDCSDPFQNGAVAGGVRPVASGYHDAMTDIDTAVVDIDGTLVDSNYLNVVAWSRAFGDVGRRIEAWRLHRSIGLPGRSLVAAVAGEAAAEAVGEAVLSRWIAHYEELLEQVVPFAGSAELLRRLRHLGLKVVLTSAGHPGHLDRVQEVLEIADEGFPIVSATDATSTDAGKELPLLAVRQVGGRRAVAIGDTVGDVEAAVRCGFGAVGLLSGGVPAPLLHDAGAAVVAPGPAALLEDLSTALESAARSGGER